MLNRDFFKEWMDYFRQVKGWNLSQTAADGIYERCRFLSEQEFQEIGVTIAETPGAKPDKLLAAVKEHRLLHRDQSAPALTAAAGEISSDRKGPMMGRRFLIWSVLCQKDESLEPGYLSLEMGKTPKISPTGEWLQSLPFSELEIAVERTSVKSILNEGFNSEIAKELMIKYEQLFEENLCNF